MSKNKINETGKRRFFPADKAKVIMATLCTLCVVLVPLLPAKAAGAWARSPAETAAETCSGPYTLAVAAASLLNLKGPEQVKAGETFSLFLNTGEEFPLLVNEDAAFFESYNDGKPWLVEICTLDAQGKAGIQLQRKKAGTYNFSVLVGPFQSEITVMILPGPPAAVRKMQKRILLEIGREATLEFALEDIYGNKIAADHTIAQPAANLLDVLITDPDDNLLPETEFELTPNPAGNFAVSFTTEKKGNYLVEARLPHETDLSASSLVCAQDPGAVSRIELILQEGEEPFLRISRNRTKPNRLKLEAILYGENNIVKTPSSTEEENIIFSTDRPDLIWIEKTAEGKATLTEKGEAGLATIYLTYIAEGIGLLKSIPLWIAGDPAQIELEAQIDDLTARVQATLLDEGGWLAWEKTQSYRLDLPAGLKLVAQTEFARGQAEFTLEAEDYGSYTLDFTTAERLHLSQEIEFLEKIKPAKHAVIFIGQESYIKDGKPATMNSAPEICYGRVYVPIEFLTAIFGVEINISPGTEKITLQSPDGTKMIVDQEAGQLTVTNTKDAAMTKTPIGTLFLQKKAGTYFVPAAIIARLLGIDVDYLPKRDQIEHVTFISK